MNHASSLSRYSSGVFWPNSAVMPRKAVAIPIFSSGMPPDVVARTLDFTKPEIDGGHVQVHWSQLEHLICLNPVAIDDKHLFKCCENFVEFTRIGRVCLR